MVRTLDNAASENYKPSNLLAAASFSVPTMESVAESDETLELCVNMTTSPPGAALATQVDLTLLTVNGSGKGNKDV